MSVLGFLSALTVAVYLLLGVNVLRSRTRTSANALLAAACALFAWWGTSVAFQLEARGLDEVWAWHRVGSLGWTLGISAITHFFLALTGRRDWLARWWVLPVLYGPGVAFWLHEVTGGSLVQSWYRGPLGWTQVLDGGWLGAAFNAFYLSYIGFGLRQVRRWGRSSPLPSRRRQARVIIVSAVVSIALATLFERVLPLTGLPTLPALGPLWLLVWLAGMWRASTEHGLLVLSAARVGREVMEAMSEAALLLDADGVILAVNPATSGLLALPDEALLGRTIGEVLAEAGGPGAAGAGPNGRRTGAPALPPSEFTLRRAGATLTLLASSSPVRGPAGEVVGTALVLSDVTARKDAEAQLAHRATHDALTGLPNRVLLADRLDLALARARRARGLAAVLVIDLDHFKAINDTLGHEAGDHVLKVSAGRLSAALRDTDTVARVGGDEFVVVLGDLDAEASAGAVAARLIAALEEPIVGPSGEMRVSASIGIACFPRDGRAGERLQQAADLAMYQAKADEVGRAAFFEPRLLAELEHRACLEQDLRRALDEGQFELHYQPIYDLDVGLPVATEALVRWRHPRLGLLLPGAFLPLATATGLMLPLGRWVLTEACRQNAQWRRDGVLDAPVAVNIAACQLHHPDFGAEVSAALEAAELPATHLHIDLTEAVASADLPATARALQGLSARGVGVYLDDFGVSGASLAVVRALDVDGVKIDRAVMAGLGGDPQDVAVVGCFVSLARALGLVVIAEGIETRRQLTALQELSQLPSPAARCDRVQGYLLSRPVTAAAIPGVVSRPAVPSLPTPAHPAATLPGPGGPPRNLKLA